MGITVLVAHCWPGFILPHSAVNTLILPPVVKARVPGNSSGPHRPCRQGGPRDPILQMEKGRL